MNIDMEMMCFIYKPPQPFGKHLVNIFRMEAIAYKPILQAALN